MLRVEKIYAKGGEHYRKVEKKYVFAPQNGLNCG